MTLKKHELLQKCLKLILNSKICPLTSKGDWPRILLFAHLRGYLYTNKDASVFVMAYRIPRWEKKWSDVMPEQESGETLYVAFAVSEGKRKISLLKILRQYLKKNEIEEIIYYKRNSDTDFKRIDLRRNHVKTNSAQSS
ncbi:hypothetical protein KW791_00550 [Candidatus Parcubacteria bacterium]|nr:hypothetical protein [Candidatus Parcubacteria bacterium]